MPLPQLFPGFPEVDVQQTAFAVDALGRYICSTWNEATLNDGPPFTAVVVGAGMYGAYCATKIVRLDPTARVLLLDAGRFLVSEHVQNLANIGFNVPSAIPPSSDPGVAREIVWGIPWRGNTEFPGLAYCTGGKSIFWGGWCPRLTTDDLAHWPVTVAQYLVDHYIDVESEIGVVPATDFIFGELGDVLRNACVSAAAVTPDIDTSSGTSGVETAPLAVQGSPPVSGLFSFDKYSSVPVLVDAIRADVGASGGNDAARRLFLVPLAHVVKLHAAGGTVHTVEVEAGGQRRFLSLTPGAAVVLAASAVETTRLALQSFPTPLMGRNLMAHLRSDFTVRVKRAALPPVPGHVQTSALLVRGLSPVGRFHVQVTASTHVQGSDDLLFRMIPDLDVLEAQLLNIDPDWITITFRGIAEMHGDRSTTIPNATTSWINLSPFESDEFAAPRAFVHLKVGAADLQTWQVMDAAIVNLAQTMAGTPASIEYRYDNGWQTQPFPLSRPFAEWHRGLGTTYHEAGTLWMGNNPATSVTNDVGRFHHMSNAYACDQSIFSTVGSVNPALTGLTLARRLAEHLAT